MGQGVTAIHGMGQGVTAIHGMGQGVTAIQRCFAVAPGYILSPPPHISTHVPPGLACTCGQAGRQGLLVDSPLSHRLPTSARPPATTTRRTTGSQLLLSSSPAPRTTYNIHSRSSTLLTTSPSTASSIHTHHLPPLHYHIHAECVVCSWATAASASLFPGPSPPQDRCCRGYHRSSSLVLPPPPQRHRGWGHRHHLRIITRHHPPASLRLPVVDPQCPDRPAPPPPSFALLIEIEGPVPGTTTLLCPPHRH